MRLARPSVPVWIVLVAGGLTIPGSFLIYTQSYGATSGPIKVALIATGYLAADLMILRLQVDAAGVQNFVASEIPLLAGAVVLAPFDHIWVRVLTATAASVLRRLGSKHRHRLLIGLVNGFVAGLEVVVFMEVLYLLGWSGSTRWLGGLMLCIAWIGLVSSGRLVAIVARLLAGQRPDLRQERREFVVMMSFSATALATAALLVGAAQ